MQRMQGKRIERKICCWNKGMGKGKESSRPYEAQDEDGDGEKNNELNR